MNTHGQNVSDIFALVAHGQGLGRVTTPLTDVARHPDVRQKVHLDLFLPIALTSLTTAASYVETKPFSLVAAHTGLGQLGEQLADQVEDASIGSWIRIG